MSYNINNNPNAMPINTGYGNPYGTQTGNLPHATPGIDFGFNNGSGYNADMYSNLSGDNAQLFSYMNGQLSVLETLAATPMATSAPAAPAAPAEPESEFSEEAATEAVELLKDANNSFMDKFWSNGSRKLDESDFDKALSEADSLETKRAIQYIKDNQEELSQLDGQSGKLNNGELDNIAEMLGNGDTLEDMVAFGEEQEPSFADRASSWIASLF